jgi:hypothetical protein
MKQKATPMLDRYIFSKVLYILTLGLGFRF